MDEVATIYHLYTPKVAASIPKRAKRVPPFLGYPAVLGWRNLPTMQRLYSMFPRGLPGLALLLLRISVAGGVLLNVYGQRGHLAAWLLVSSLLLAATLLAGILTPLVALLALGANLAIPMSCNVGFQSAGHIAIATINALALCLLGPGSYSLDAFLFGRRVINLTPPDGRERL
jgi:hypothetical protein